MCYCHDKYEAVQLLKTFIRHKRLVTLKKQINHECHTKAKDQLPLMHNSIGKIEVSQRYVRLAGVQAMTDEILTKNYRETTCLFAGILTQGIQYSPE